MTSALRQLRLPPMPKISELIRLYGLKAKKQLSQNFILDLNVTDKIARCADVFDCHVVEVGAGPGSLTRSLINHGIQHLHAVEIDGRFLPSLQILEEASLGHMSIHHNDIMTFDIPSIIQNPISAQWDSDELPNVRLVGNLPFAVSVPLLLQWIEGLSRQSGPWKFGRVPMTLVFQKEVGENMIAEEYNYHRSRLSIMTQNYCHVSRPMVLNSTVFIPEPKVDAWVMHFIPRRKSIIDAPFDIIEQVVKAIFTKRRKVIRTSLQLLFPEEQKHLADELLERVQLKPTYRAHQLSLEQYNLITQEFMKMCKELNLSMTPLKVNKPSLIKSH